MLCIAFTIGAARYAVEALHVERVIPLLDITPVPRASTAIVGVCNYHGEPIPVVDVSVFAGHPPAARLLSTRLIVIKRDERRLALLAAGVTETARIPADAWAGPYASRGTGFIRRIDLDLLMTTVGAAE
jgi:chemotaxis signal transduction protein